MRCSKCGGRTEVLETVQKDQRTQRRRQCMVCSHRFTTRELPADEVHKSAEDAIPGWLEKMAKRGLKLDTEAVMAAVRTDRRKAEIRDQQLELARKEREALRDAGFDEQADKLSVEMLRRELEGY